MPCLNPYSNGILPDKQLSMALLSPSMVLILILMEYSLTLAVYLTDNGKFVLILILMEYSLTSVNSPFAGLALVLILILMEYSLTRGGSYSRFGG